MKKVLIIVLVIAAVSVTAYFIYKAVKKRSEENQTSTQNSEASGDDVLEVLTESEKDKFQSESPDPSDVQMNLGMA